MKLPQVDAALTMNRHGVVAYWLLGMLHERARSADVAAMAAELDAAYWQIGATYPWGC
jgi:hypothetical protein